MVEKKNPPSATPSHQRCCHKSCTAHSPHVPPAQAKLRRRVQLHASRLAAVTQPLPSRSACPRKQQGGLPCAAQALSHPLQALCTHARPPTPTSTLHTRTCSGMQTPRQLITCSAPGPCPLKRCRSMATHKPSPGRSTSPLSATTSITYEPARAFQRHQGSPLHHRHQGAQGHTEAKNAAVHPTLGLVVARLPCHPNPDPTRSGAGAWRAAAAWWPPSAARQP